MTELSTDAMREKLLALRRELEAVAETGEESAAVVELDQSKVGRLSRMDAMQAQAMAQASEARREVLLRGIDAALRRIEDGSYGLCRDCNEPIDPRRMEVDPTVLRCVDCAAKFE